jgi:2-methylfumaryl-CoA hydratase
MIEPRYGRCLDDFARGEVYAHPWDVTLDDGMIAFFAASFQDAMPTFASRTYAANLGFSARPVHPLLLLNLGLSFSVHDVSEQAIAHLAYIDVRFPAACYAGDTVTATSKVLDVKPSSKGDRGVVEVRTLLTTDRGDVVCRFDRRALVRAGSVSGRPAGAWPEASQSADESSDRPRQLRDGVKAPQRLAGFSGFFEDFQVGDLVVHGVGKTVGESEHMQLTQLCRNSHPIHFDEVYCKQHSFAKTRVVYGGLVLSWVLALTSRRSVRKRAPGISGSTRARIRTESLPATSVRDQQGDRDGRGRRRRRAHAAGGRHQESERRRARGQFRVFHSRARQE